MSEYWKSVPRKFCEFCKCWLTDNKPSVEFHERGKRHQENVAKKLTELRKKGKKDFEAKKKMDAQFRKMNEAAMQAYQKDVERDPSLAREFEELQKATATTSSEPAKPEPAPTFRGMKSKKQNAPSKQVIAAAPVYCDVGPANSSTPYGQWTTIDNSVPKAVDLQLPEQRERIDYKVVTDIPEESFKFKEKTVSSANVIFSKAGDATFRKRKFNHGSFMRNMKRKEANDAD